MSKLFIKNGHCYELKPEESKKTFGIPVVMKITMAELEEIIVTSLEGGIGYWAMLDINSPEWDNKPKDIPTSQYALELLIAKCTLKFVDAEGSEDDNDWILTLDKLLKGIALDFENYKTDLANIDGEDADRIIQYALFGDILYG